MTTSPTPEETGLAALLDAQQISAILQSPLSDDTLAAAYSPAAYAWMHLFHDAAERMRPAANLHSHLCQIVAAWQHAVTQIGKAPWHFTTKEIAQAYVANPNQPALQKTIYAINCAQWGSGPGSYTHARGEEEQELFYFDTFTDPQLRADFTRISSEVRAEIAAKYPAFGSNWESVKAFFSDRS